MSDTTQYMLDYDGLKIITDNVVQRCVPLTGFEAKINNTIQRVMRSFDIDFIQYATSFEDLPPIGTQGILYMIMKRPGDYVVYSFEDNKYVQVGASTFKKDFDPDVELNANSTNMVTNAAITTELNKKYTKTGMVGTPTDNSSELVESSGIKSVLDLKANSSDFSLMNKYDLRKIFYTEYTNGAYLRVYIRFYNKDLLVNLAESGNFKPAIHNLNLGNLKYYTYDNKESIINDSVSSVPVTWRGSDKYYHSTVRIGHRVNVGTDSSNTGHITKLFSTANRWLRLANLTDGNLFLEVTFTDKIPVEVLMNTTLAFNELMTTGESDIYGKRYELVHNSVYITTEVSTDAVHWNIWRDDQQMYNATAATDGALAGEGTFSIPVFR